MGNANCEKVCVFGRRASSVNFGLIFTILRVSGTSTFHGFLPQVAEKSQIMGSGGYLSFKPPSFRSIPGGNDI